MQKKPILYVNKQEKRGVRNIGMSGKSLNRSSRFSLVGNTISLGQERGFQEECTSEHSGVPWARCVDEERHGEEIIQRVDINNL